MGVVSLSPKPSAPSIWQPGTRCAQIWMICVPPSAPPAQLAVAQNRRYALYAPLPHGCCVYSA